MMGAEIPVILANTAELSSQVPRFTAATTPSKMPKIVANNMAAKANNKVPGKASINNCPTAFLV